MTTNALDRFRLDGKTALVTGASRNIGKAIAEAYADAGADLVLVARKEPALSAAAEEIRSKTGRTVTPRTCDVGSDDQVGALLADLAASGIRIDVLVNNAVLLGGTYGTPLLETTDEPWRRTLEVNLFGPLRLARGLIPGMMEAGGGSIINVLSGAAFSPMATMAPYGVSKAALWTLTRYLARECAPVVRVNGLCPGSMREDDDPRPLETSQIAMTPMARTASGREAAGAALYLASDASSFSTGEVVFANGGLNALSSYFAVDPAREVRERRDAEAN